MIAVTGLNHLTLAVSDLDRAVTFYVDALGMTLRKRWSGGAYLSAGDLWLCLSLDEQSHICPLPDYTHFAFDIPAASFDALTRQIKNAGGRQWKENRSEGDSFYFLDPDGHKLEIHVGTLDSRLAAMPC